MTPMEPTGTPPAFQPGFEFCYRHPNVGTGVHCTRCGKPICPDCMIPAPVGYQCPDCVGQARKEFRSRAMTLGPRGGISMTKALLIAIGAMFAVELIVGGGEMINPSSLNANLTLYKLGALDPFSIALQGQWWRLFTSMFLHAGVIHIGFNAYALYLFGPVVEGTFGRARFLLIYFVSGFVASAASYAFIPLIPSVQHHILYFDGPLGVGASGAIVGVFGAFIAYNWRRRELALARQNLRTAATLIVLNALIPVFVAGIDWRAHLGGLVCGFAAGLFAESWGPSPATRRFIRIAGFAALIAIGVALVVWRSSTFPQPVPM